jgi:WD40 repeat protein
MQNALAAFFLFLITTDAFGQLSLEKTLKSNGGYVYSVAFSPDGKSIAFGSHEKKITIFTIASNEMVNTSLNSIPVSMEYSPDGSTLAAGMFDGSLVLWNIENRTSALFKEHEESVYSVAFSPDSNLLASASNDKTVRMWSVANKESRVLYKGNVSQLDFTPDGKMLIVGNSENEIIFCGVKTGLVKSTLRGSRMSISSLAISSDGKLLATGTFDIQLWDISS